MSEWRFQNKHTPVGLGLAVTDLFKKEANDSRRPPITHEQFRRLVRQCQGAIREERSRLSITVMDDYKAFLIPGIAFQGNDTYRYNIAKKNEESTTLRTADLDEITPEIWDDAAYVEVRILFPEDDMRTFEYDSFASLQFKGRYPHSVYMTVAFAKEEIIHTLNALNPDLASGRMKIILDQANKTNAYELHRKTPPACYLIPLPA